MPLHACLRQCLLLQETGTCTSLHISCLLLPALGACIPWGWVKHASRCPLAAHGQQFAPAFLPVLCTGLSDQCKDKFAIWGVQGCQLAPSEAVGLHFNSWGLMVVLSRHSRPMAEHQGAPSSLPTMAKPWCLGSWKHPSSG